MSVTTYKTKSDLISWQKITPGAVWLLVEDDPVKGTRVVAPIAKKRTWIRLKQALVKAVSQQMDATVTNVNIGGDDGFGSFQVACKVTTKPDVGKPKSEAMWLSLRISPKY